MIRMIMAVVAIATYMGASPTAQTTGRGSAQKAPAPARASSVRIAVRDQDGGSLNGVRLVLSGAGTGEFETGAAGTAIVPDLKDGVYRIRCEREGYVTLEREFTVHGSAWNPIDVVLHAAPPPPPPPPPPPAREPDALRPGGPALTVSIVDFLDRNLIGREPLKESILACKPLETVRLLQMREAVSKHVHERIDEIVYVIAGEGAVRIGEETVLVKPSSLVVVPHGTQHAFERRGKNPLVVMSTLVGSPCEPSQTTSSR